LSLNCFFKDFLAGTPTLFALSDEHNYSPVIIEQIFTFKKGKSQEKTQYLVYFFKGYTRYGSKANK